MSRAPVHCLGERVGVPIDAGGRATMPPSPPWLSASRLHDVTRKPSKHQACRRDLDERLARLHTALIVLRASFLKGDTRSSDEASGGGGGGAPRPTGEQGGGRDG